MKLCDTCIYRNNVEQLKPCIIYRDDCEYYEKERDMTREESIKELQESHDIMRSYDIDESESRLMTALDMAIKALEQEPTKEEQALLQKWRDNRGISIEDFEGAMNALQEPKTGHWIDRTSGYAFNDECSECGYVVHIQFIKEYQFCPHCGAKMFEPQESEDKE